MPTDHRSFPRGLPISTFPSSAPRTTPGPQISPVNTREVRPNPSPGKDGPADTRVHGPTVFLDPSRHLPLSSLVWQGKPGFSTTHRPEKARNWAFGSTSPKTTMAEDRWPPPGKPLSNGLPFAGQKPSSVLGVPGEAVSGSGPIRSLWGCSVPHGLDLSQSSTEYRVPGTCCHRTGVPDLFYADHLLQRGPDRMVPHRRSRPRRKKNGAVQIKSNKKGKKKKEKERTSNSNSSPSRAKIALALRVTSSVKARWFQEQVQSYSHGAADYGTWRRSPSGIRHGRRLLSRVENADRLLALRGRFPEVYMEACHPD